MGAPLGRLLADGPRLELLLLPFVCVCVCVGVCVVKILAFIISRRKEVSFIIGGKKKKCLFHEPLVQCLPLLLLRGPAAGAAACTSSSILGRHNTALRNGEGGFSLRHGGAAVQLAQPVLALALAKVQAMRDGVRQHVPAHRLFVVGA